MIHARNYNVFELDDFPIDWEFTIKTLREFRRHNKRFKANLFCVPSHMKAEHWRELAKYDWIKVFPHGFRHRRGECTDAEIPDDKRRKLDKLRNDPKWGNVFKAPRYGYSNAFLQGLHDSGFDVALNSLNRLDALPNIWSWDRRFYEFHALSKWQYTLRHPRYLTGRVFGQPVRSGHFSSLGQRFNTPYKKFLRGGANDLEFAFVDELLRPAKVKINCGCGPHHFADWINLDHRPKSDLVQKWLWPNPIPCTANRADLVYSAHFLNYLDDYIPFFLEVWRVLRPGGVYRFEEDATESGYQWGKIGKKHVTGTIRSAPTKQSIFDALQRVGFRFREVQPMDTDSDCRDVFGLITRPHRQRRGQQFVAEAVKDIKIKNLTRAYLDDFRAPRHGEYPYSLTERIQSR